MTQKAHDGDILGIDGQSIDCVVGLTLRDARIRLKDTGTQIGSIMVTAPPRLKSSEYDEDYRILRQKYTSDGKIELLICKPL